MGAGICTVSLKIGAVKIYLQYLPVSINAFTNPQL